MDRGDIVRNVADAILGQPLVNNVFRGLVAEAVVDAALPETWKWCSGDWAAYDFLHAAGARLEVKQSAAKQTWHKDGDKPSAASFDIALRTMDFVDNKWVPISERSADIYVFAYAVVEATAAWLIGSAPPEVGGRKPIISSRRNATSLARNLCVASITIPCTDPDAGSGGRFAAHRKSGKSSVSRDIAVFPPQGFDHFDGQRTGSTMCYRIAHGRRPAILSNPCQHLPPASGGRPDGKVRNSVAEEILHTLVVSQLLEFTIFEPVVIID